MKTSTLVSVVMPCFNSERWITEAVGSLLQQTHKNIELILVDDASTDRTYALLTSMARSDGRVRLFRNEKNLGIAKTRNVGLKHARGTYYAPADHDDISAPTRIQKQLEFLVKNPEYSAIGCQIKTIDKGGRLAGERKYPTAHEDVLKLLPITSPICNPASLICVGKFRELGLAYDESIGGVEDYDLWFKLANRYKLANLNEYLYYYRISDEQVTKNRTKQILLLSQKVQRKWLFNGRFYNNKALLIHIMKYFLLLLPTKIILSINNTVNYKGG